MTSTVIDERLFLAIKPFMEFLRYGEKGPSKTVLATNERGTTVLRRRDFERLREIWDEMHDLPVGTNVSARHLALYLGCRKKEIDVPFAETHREWWVRQADGTYTRVLVVPDGTRVSGLRTTGRVRIADHTLLIEARRRNGKNVTWVPVEQVSEKSARARPTEARREEARALAKLSNQKDFVL